jgi:isopentenyl-diphosphate delta-isomerase
MSKGHSAVETTQQRKQEHLEVCLKHDVGSNAQPLWDGVQLPHIALPEISLSDVSLDVDLWGQKLDSPLFISSMTGGSEQADQLNLRLARLAERNSIAMGVGSQRVALENRASNRHSASFLLRKEAPTATLFANIGAVQLNYGVSIDDCQWLVESIEASALILHLNPLQESIQPEGDTNFSGLWKKIESLKSRISAPLILKETGCGLDLATCKRAFQAGVDAIDSAGMGGSHWGYIEGLRHPNKRELGEAFRDWGIPSTDALKNAVEGFEGSRPVFASGGIRNGVDVAKAIYSGATLAGMALPFIKAAEKGEDELQNFLDLQNSMIRVAYFCTGSRNSEELKRLRR